MDGKKRGEPGLSRTETYSEDESSQKTTTYGDDSGPERTQAYGPGSRSDTTEVYDAEGAAQTDRTVTHGLGVGDSVELRSGNYRITEIVSGENTTGEAVIYLVQDEAEKDYAFKLYYPFTDHRDEPNPEALKRIKSIIDPDILRLHDFGTGPDKYQGKFCYELCDYAAGRDLLSINDLKEKYTPDFLESNVIPEIFKGIHTLHKHKIYHCDIKPENIFYLDQEQTDLVIGDYGSAKTFEEASRKELSYTSTTKGTNFYLAPEQARGIISEKNDFYSFGMVLLHLVYPHAVTREHLRKIIERQFSRKPIIDFNPAFGRLNDIIAGLTLYDINARWGKEQVEAWLNGDAVEVHYSGGAETALIKIGSTVIKTVDDLVAYIESTPDWHENLVEDQTGYSLFLRWVAEIQDIRSQKVFDNMVRTYQQDGVEYLTQAVLRYFDADRPVLIEMKQYDFWNAPDLAGMTAEFVKHLDEIWKITPLDTLKFYLFQLEFCLRQIEANASAQDKVLINALLDRISSALSCKPKTDFNDYICTFYPDLTHENLIELFYAFNEHRAFRDLEGKRYDTIEKIGLFFAANEGLFDNEYLRLEKNVFCRRHNLSHLTSLEYKEFLFGIFESEINPEVELINISLVDDELYEIKYKYKKSLSHFFKQKKISKQLTTGASTTNTFTKTRCFLQSIKSVFSDFLQHVQESNGIDVDSLSPENREQLRKQFEDNMKAVRSLVSKKEFFLISPFVLFVIIWASLFAFNTPFGETYYDYLIKDGLADYAQNAEEVMFTWSFYYLYAVFAIPSFLALALLISYNIILVSNPASILVLNIIMLGFPIALKFYNDLWAILGLAALGFGLSICIPIHEDIDGFLRNKGSFKYHKENEELQNQIAGLCFVCYFLLKFFLLFSSDPSAEGTLDLFAYIIMLCVLFFITTFEPFYASSINHSALYQKTAILIAVILPLIFFSSNYLNHELSLAQNESATFSSDAQHNDDKKVIDSASVSHQSFSTPHENPTVSLAEVIVGKANLRSGPSTKAMVVGQLTKGDTVQIISRYNDKWSEIRYKDESAYIYSSLISLKRYRIDGSYVDSWQAVKVNSKPQKIGHAYDDDKMFFISSPEFWIVSKSGRTVHGGHGASHQDQVYFTKFYNMGKDGEDVSVMSEKEFTLYYIIK